MFFFFSFWSELDTFHCLFLVKKGLVDVQIACQIWSPGVVNDPDAVVQKTDSLAKVLQLSASGQMWYPGWVLKIDLFKVRRPRLGHG